MTEVEGWREALLDGEVLAVLFWRLLLTFCASVVGVASCYHVGPWATVWLVMATVLVVSLATLRIRGRP